MRRSIRSRPQTDSFIHRIKRIDHELPVDCNWTKPEWTKTPGLEIDRANNWAMTFKPKTAMKMCYSDKCVYLIYRVEDRFVRCLTSEVNGPVHRDGGVEFFFSPAENNPQSYFNLEINCGGTIKLGYREGSRPEAVHAGIEDVKKIIVSHSLPDIIRKEIEEPVVWTLEIAVPFEILNNYSPVPVPRSGSKWRANFFKCAENNSHPHWLSWAPIASPSPNFHLPEFFGEVEFS